MKIFFAVLLVVLPVIVFAQETAMPPMPPLPPLPPEEGNVMFYRAVPGPMGLHAHMPQGNWWKGSEIAQQLQLTDQQRQQLEQAFVEHRMKLVDLRAAVEKQEIKLQSLMDSDRPPESQVMAQLDQLLAARGNLEKEFTAMTLNFRRIVTPEQWRKLQSTEGKHRQVIMFRGAGHGVELPQPPPR